MQPSSLNLLLVEDEAILALDLRARLEREGYRVVGTASTGRSALALFEEHPVDLVLCDISLRGDWDGIETARRLAAHRPVALIYLTAHTDRETVEEAKKTFPGAYLTKPVTTDALRIAIEMAFHNFAFRAALPVSPDDKVRPLHPDASREAILQVGDTIFIKQNYQFVRIHLSDLLYLEADSSYTTLVTAGRKFTLRLSLNAMLDRVPHERLVRIHRSFAVNLDRIESFNEYEITVVGRALPLGRSYKDAFLSQFRFR